MLALGGGTVEDESSRSLLLHSPGNCLVFLEAELPELLSRCTVEGRVRPLLAARKSLEARHTRRLPHYRTAHVTVETPAWRRGGWPIGCSSECRYEWLIEAGKR